MVGWGLLRALTMHEFLAHNFRTKFDVRSFLGETEFLSFLTSLFLCSYM